MSWVYDNKFVVGVGAAMLAGAGALGYMTLSAKDGYAAASAEFSVAAGKLENYENLKPFPSEASLKELVSEKQKLSDKLNALSEDFKKRVLPVKPVTKEAFQDRLKDTVAAVTAGCAKASVELPGKDFYLGYLEYRDKPPEDSAAPLLARQLRSIELVMELLIQEGNLQLKELTRETFADERQKPKTQDPKPPPPKPGSGKPGPAKPTDKAARQLVDKTGFTIKFIGSDEAFRRIVNGIVGNKKQIFIIRRIAAQNEKPVPPVKTVASAPAPPTPATPAGETPATPAPIPAAPGPAVTLEYLFGKEQVAATIDIEVLDFAEPEKQNPKGSDGKKK